MIIYKKVEIIGYFIKKDEPVLIKLIHSNVFTEKLIGENIFILQVSS